MRLVPLVQLLLDASVIVSIICFSQFELASQLVHCKGLTQPMCLQDFKKIVVCIGEQVSNASVCDQ